VLPTGTKKKGPSVPVKFKTMTNAYISPEPQPNWTKGANQKAIFYL
jgi:hypothetical protein